MLHRVMAAVFKFVPIPSLNHHDALHASNVSGNDMNPSVSAASLSSPPVHLDTESNSLTTDKYDIHFNNIQIL